ncbi:NADH-ubiquinone oxidoreductase-F iron-sulfur binding region domain-containing protein, partial [Verrucomicrobiota bacterium]
LKQSDKPVIFVGTATCGRSAGSLETLDAMRNDTKKRGIDCSFVEVGCLGLCYAEPIVVVAKPGKPAICYSEVDAAKAARIAQAYLAGDDPCAEFAMGSIGDDSINGMPNLFEIPVLKDQVRRVLRNCGFIDPTNIDHYIANEGYRGFQKALKLGSPEVMKELKKSGLRGRGGAGFPTWRKWQFCMDAKGDKKYLVCNADEGDPGAFMNRSLLEGDPHSLLEGMLIGGFILGATEGYIYCRAEYPLALERLETAIGQAKEYGLIGDAIMGSGFSFHIKVREGAGAFVCGEETALIASLEGKRGMPRPRPPFPAVSGLWGKPTVINNVETLASVALIMQKGAKWFAEYGAGESKGTKTFALVGMVKRTGLVEVPLGITLKKMIFDIGGGVADDGKFKAVQTGGPSGGCIPHNLLDIPVDYDTLKQAGSIMGSGGMVVMDETTCMVDFARYFLDFAQKESCGECIPCRLGTKQLFTILTDICEGRGKPDDIDLLKEIAEGVKAGSLCGLGQTAPNPVLTTIRYFRDEYAAHIEGKKCPAKVCKALITYTISDRCTGCRKCVKNCPVSCITGEKKKKHVINRDLCTKCGVCRDVCPFNAVDVN